MQLDANRLDASENDSLQFISPSQEESPLNPMVALLNADDAGPRPLPPVKPGLIAGTVAAGLLAWFVAWIWVVAG